MPRPEPAASRRKPPGAAAFHRPSGFTLIEVLVVLAILGVAAGLVVARGAWHSDTLDVRAAADQLAASLRTTRAAAFRTGKPWTLRVDAARGLLLPALGPAVRLPRGVRVLGVGRGTTMISFDFQADGACNGGSIVLSEGHVKRLVTVDFLSGRISVGS